MTTVKKKKPTKKKFTLPAKNHFKTVIIAVIGLAGLMVILATFNALFFTPERIVKTEIESLAKNYYENNIYKNILDTNADDFSSGKKSLESIMEKYTNTGFSIIYLRQLLLVNSDTHPNTTTTIKRYCDENRTSLIIFPDPPYGKNDYHIDYTYDCSF